MKKLDGNKREEKKEQPALRELTLEELDHAVGGVTAVPRGLAAAWSQRRD